MALDTAALADNFLGGQRVGLIALLEVVARQARKDAKIDCIALVRKRAQSPRWSARGPAASNDNGAA